MCMNNTKTLVIKKLSQGLCSTGGRNNTGSITSYHRGGGHKQKYRQIDFRRPFKNLPAKVLSIDHDPQRTGLIALLCYSTGILSYILAPEGLKVGDIIYPESQYTLGNTLKLKDINPGVVIHNIELNPGRGAQLVRAAGTGVQLVKGYNYDNYVVVQLRSGEHRLISKECQAAVGTVSNGSHREKSLRKAGKSRWLGRRPKVRGVAMNPVDHPHGGGEGKTTAGHPPVTPWGKLTKGQPTRHSLNPFVLKTRRKVNSEKT
jgi:large subunit ribosomal protein L2